NLAKSVANDLIANGKVSRGYIGVQISEVDAATARAVGLGEPRGVLVQDIIEGGAASKADIEVGDIILKVDQKETNQANELQSYVASRRAGTVVKLTIFREGKQIERDVTLKARDKDESKPVTASTKLKKGKDVDAKEMSFDNIGLSVRNLTSDEREEYKVKSGLLITNVKNYGKAFNQGLIAGAVIVSADKKEVNSVSELKEIYDKKKGDAVLLKVVDGKGNSRLVGIEIPR
ncbi:MAG: PDZ domain-containing protein, partial [Bacteroidota bacterium]